MTTQTRTDNQFYIRLVSKKPLQKDSVVRFYKFVKAHSPSGILSSLQVERPNYGLDTVRLIHKTDESGSVYEIPLSRHLTENEYNVIKDAFQLLSEEGQSLESSTQIIPLARYLPGSNPQLVSDDFETFCDTLAKHQHSNWCLEKAEAGWRYGLEHDPKEKMSPLLRPWQDLPDQYRRIDKKLPQQIFDALESLGYVIVPRSELEKLTKKKKK